MKSLLCVAVLLGSVANAADFLMCVGQRSVECNHKGCKDVETWKYKLVVGDEECKLDTIDCKGSFLKFDGFGLIIQGGLFIRITEGSLISTVIVTGPESEKKHYGQCKRLTGT